MSHTTISSRCEPACAQRIQSAKRGASARRIIVRLLLLTMIDCAAYAQDSQSDLIHWAFASYFGTGRYSIGDSKDVYTLSVRPRWEQRETELSADGTRKLGIVFRLPMSVGLHNLQTDAPLENLKFDNVSTLSAVPGIEIEIPMSERWSLRPLAYVGWGTELDGSASSWIYWAGIKSQLLFHTESMQWALVNSLIYVGYTPNRGPSNGVFPLSTGFEFKRPLGSKKMGGDPVFLHWHVAYTDYVDGLDFDIGEPDRSTIDLADEWELGIAFSKGENRLRFWRLSWDRVGLAYRFSSSGDFEGISLTFRSLFDR